MDLNQLSIELKRLQIGDLLTLQEQLTRQLRIKIEDKDDEDRWFITYTEEETQREIAEIFTPEELEAARKVDLNNLRPLPKPLSHYIMEERGGHVEQCDICLAAGKPLQSCSLNMC